MEVHHPHHPTHKKDWKEYITEFIMLFAAVSLGFLAENFREQYIEKERAHELLESFMADVNVNVKLLDSLIEGNRKMIMKNDSAILYMMKNDEVSLEILYEMLPLQSFRYLNNNETYHQMKSSGSLRYIKDKTLLRNIIEYNNISKATEYRSVAYEAEYIGDDYTNTLQRWMPPEIAIKRHTTPYMRRSDYKKMMKTPDDVKLMKELDDLTNNKTNIIRGQDLIKLKKELIPVISRKGSLVSGSEALMIRTRAQADILINYYNNLEH